MPADLAAIREAFCAGNYAFTATGYGKMRKRGLSVEELEEAICRDSPELIEDYPAAPRGAACLIFGWTTLAKPLHVEVGYGPAADSVVDIITVYEPDPGEWYNHRVRRKR